MASHNAAAKDGRTGRRRSTVNEDDDLGYRDNGSASRQLEAFGRKVTATAGQLIAPLGDGHYQSALGDLQRELRRPMLQRSVYSLVQMRSSFASAPEQHRRALAYLPEELLQHVPESGAAYSLFEGFQAAATAREAEAERGAAGRRGRKGRNARGQKLVADVEGGAAVAAEGGGPPSLAQLKGERQFLDRRLDTMGIRKSMCSAEIREIDGKIAGLATMRKVVMDRLAGLENEETELEHELVELDNNIEDVEETLQAAAAATQHAPSTPTITDDAGGTVTPPSLSMSDSIYATASPPSTLRRGRKASRRSMPVLHEHMEPGSLIRAFPAHTDIVTALGFDAPFGTLVTASLDDTMRVWDLHAGRCVGMLEGHLSSARVVQVEETLVASGAMDASVRLWDLSRAEYAAPASASITKRTPASDDSVEGGSGPNEDDDDDDEADTPAPNLQNCALTSLTGHVAEVTALHFHGDTLVSGGADRTLRHWDLATGRCVQTLDVLWAAAQSSAAIGATDVSFRGASSAADFVGALQVYGAALAVGFADSMIRLFDLRSGKVHRSLVGHTDAVTALQFDDLHLVTASQDRSVRIWDLRTGTIFDAFAYDAPITSMHLDDRRIVSAAGEPVVKVFDKPRSHHWDCGPGAVAEDDAERARTATIERVRIRDGFLVEGRRDGMVGIWSC